MKRLIAGILLVTIGGFTQTRGAERELSQNGVLQYWLAFASIGEIKDKGDQEMLSHPGRAPAGPERTALVNRLEGSMQAMHRGSSMAQWDWGTDVKENGPEILMPHLSKVREFARAAALVVHEKFSKGQYNEGIQCATDAITMGRSLSHHGPIICKLVEVSATQIVVGALAAEVPTMPKAALIRLQEALDKLPASVPVADVILTEEEEFEWFEQHIADPDVLWKNMGQIFTNGCLNDDLKLKPGSTPSPKMKAIVAEVRAMYSECINCTRQPFKAAQTCLKALEAKVALMGPVPKNMFPGFISVTVMFEGETCNLLMLRAGIQIVLNGEKDAAKTVDPYGDGPFVYEGAKGGFVLRSRLDMATRKRASLNFFPEPLKENTAVLPPKPPAEDQGQF